MIDRFTPNKSIILWSLTKDNFRRKEAEPRAGPIPKWTAQPITVLIPLFCILSNYSNTVASHASTKIWLNPNFSPNNKNKRKKSTGICKQSKQSIQWRISRSYSDKKNYSKQHNSTKAWLILKNKAWKIVNPIKTIKPSDLSKIRKSTSHNNNKTTINLEFSWGKNTNMNSKNSWNNKEKKDPLNLRGRNSNALPKWTDLN